MPERAAAPARGTRVVRALLFLLASPLLATLGAQTVRGVVLRQDTLPVAGVAVTLLDPAGAGSGSAVTDELGRFELRAPRVGTWRLQAEAVGFKRVVTLPFDVAVGVAGPRRIHLTEATARLTALRVTERTRCDARPAEGTQVATLWDEAQKSLAIANASTAASPLFALDYEEIEYDSSFTRAFAATRRTTTGRVAQVFRSAPPASLRALGYVRLLDSTTLYFGPDARTLLSNDFAATHCFALDEEDPTSIRRVGIAFTPVGRPREVTDITGTIWLDRTTYELDRVDFRFDPVVSGDHPDSTFGGSVHFARAPGGQVIVRRWALRMPVFASAEERRLAPPGATSRMIVRSAQREVVVGMKVDRGLTRLATERPLPLPPVVPRRGRYAGPACNADSLARVQESGLAGLVYDARSRVVAGAPIRASWRRVTATGSRLVVRDEWIETASDQLGRYAVCGMPRGVRVTIAVSSRATQLLRVRVVAPDSVAVDHHLRLAERVLVVSPSAEGTLRGRVVDAAGRGVARAQVAFLSSEHRALTDSTGSFTVDALPPQTYDIFVRRVGYVPVIVSLAVPAADTADVEFALEVNAQSLAPVTVEASVLSLNLRGFEIRREQRFGFGFYVGLEELSRRRSSTIVNVIRTGGPITVEESQQSGDAYAFGRMSMNAREIEGMTKCPMRIMLDGAMMAEMTPLNALPPVSEIAGIEIYTSTGSIPPQFLFGAVKCGIIIVWTKDGTEP